MATTYAAAYTPRRPTIARRSGASTTRRYNDPDANYTDPAWSPPPFVSRLQPLSFTSSMAPERVAYCPVPLAYPNAPSYSAQQAQPQTARFSTTSLASRKAAEAAEGMQRMGMSGAEAFRFALRAETGSFTGRPKSLPIPHGHGQHHFPPSEANAKRSLTDPRVSAKLPPSAFYYHVNHTRSMTRENKRQASFRSPTNSSVIVTTNVYPRAATLQNTNPYAPPGQPPQALFPVAYNPGHMGSTARQHAFDAKSIPEPIYDSFPLHPHQNEFRMNPKAPTFRLDQTTSKFVEDEIASF